MLEFRQHVRRAVEIAGSQEKLAKAAGFSQQQVSYLLHIADRISLESALLIEKATEGRVSRRDLRPDIFGCDSSEAVAS